MAVTATPIFPQTITSGVVQILPADTTTLKTLYTAGAQGSKIENLDVTNTDSAAAYAIQVWVVISATNHLLGTVNVPLSSGNTVAAPNVSILAGLTGLNKDSNGNPYIYLATGAVLKVSSLTTVTAAKIVDFYCQGGDY